MLQVRTYTVGALPDIIFSGAPESPPPNRLMGRSSVLIKVREGGNVFIGGPDVSDVDGLRLTAGSALSLSPLGPTDVIWAVAEGADAVVEVLHQGMVP